MEKLLNYIGVVMALIAMIIIIGWLALWDVVFGYPQTAYEKFINNQL